jgi:hypothetical protein
MADRVLNFSEFQNKYSEESEQDSAVALSNFSTAADSFSAGFDDSTYDEAQLGPKRPISSAEKTPVQPGEAGAPKFNSSATSGTEFPDEAEDEEGEEETDVNPTYGAYDYEDGGNPEDDEEEDEDKENDEEEEDEDKENDEEEDDEEEEDEEDDEETNESRLWNRSKGLVESFDTFSNRGGQPREYDDISKEFELIDFSDSDDEDYDADYWQDDEDVVIPHDDDCYVYCKSCGSKKMLEPGDKPYGTMNQMDPDSWWQGTELGMQCGCNM